MQGAGDDVVVWSSDERACEAARASARRRLLIDRADPSGWPGPGRSFTQSRWVDRRLSFGRKADLELDSTNRFMHRRTGEFRRDDLTWWIDNHATQRSMVIFGSDGTRRVVPPGSSSTLIAPVGTVSLGAGSNRYDLTYRMLDHRSNDPGAAVPTRLPSRVVLSAREIVVLVELARPWLSGAGYHVPSVTQVAERTGIKAKWIEHAIADLLAERTPAFSSIQALVVDLVASGALTVSHLLRRSVALGIAVPEFDA